MEIPLERVCSVQKRLVASSNAVGKPVIVATELLDSMISHLRPTRAEASDVANAVFDGADCVVSQKPRQGGSYLVKNFETHHMFLSAADVIGGDGRWKISY